MRGVTPKWQSLKLHTSHAFGEFHAQPHHVPAVNRNEEVLCSHGLAFGHDVQSWLLKVNHLSKFGSDIMPRPMRGVTSWRAPWWLRAGAWRTSCRSTSTDWCRGFALDEMAGATANCLRLREPGNKGTSFSRNLGLWLRRMTPMSGPLQGLASGSYLVQLRPSWIGSRAHAASVACRDGQDAFDVTAGGATVAEGMNLGASCVWMTQACSLACSVLSAWKTDWQLKKTYEVPGRDCDVFVVGVAPTILPAAASPPLPNFVSVNPSGDDVAAATAPRSLLGVLASATVALAMSDPPGIYAAEASGSDPLSAETAQERLEAMRTGRWREKMGLVADDDFAFAFSSFEEAVMNAGHHVASDWLHIRQEREEPHNLLPDVVEAVETEARAFQPSGSCEVKLEVGVTRRGPMRSGLRPQSRLRLRPGPDQPEQVQLRVNGLRKAFREAGALRPVESMDAARTALWGEQLDRLAKEVVTLAEPVTVTVLNGLKTWTELRTYLEEKERPFPPDHLDIYGYLKDGAKAPARAHASLRWFVKQGKLAWDVGVATPAPRQERRPNEQACAPPMIPELEEWGSQVVGTSLSLDPDLWHLALQAYPTCHPCQGHQCCTPCSMPEGQAASERQGL